MTAKTLRIAFLLNPLQEMRHEDDTSFYIMTECQRRGHQIYCLESRDLILHRDKLYADIAECETDVRRGIIRHKPKLVPLDRWDCLFVRKEPPFDQDYLSMTYMLDFLKKKVFIMNDPSGIRFANEKLSSLHGHDYAPESITAYRASLAEQLIKKRGIRKIVIKPLFNKGGKGILEWPQKSVSLEKGFTQAKSHSTKSPQPVQLQTFISHKASGDKRILLLEGRPLGAFRRIAGKKDFRANMALGAKAAQGKIYARDRKIILSIKNFLKTHGLYFVGIDILNGYLTEVNVTSPAGVPEINEFDGIKTERPIVDFIERRS